MKVKIFYEAVHTMEIELDEKYRPLCETSEEDYTDEKSAMTTEMINNINAYIQQIDPNFVDSTGMVGIDVDVDWEW